ncbi:MAG: YdeI family protein [Myxococcota bacterium]
MQLPNTLRVTTRSLWRAWLRKHHKTAKEVWLLVYKRDTARDAIEYEDAIEEALCFGWIDGMIRRVDDATFARRFSPRRLGSEWSALNQRRVERMIARRKMTPAGLAAFKVPPRPNRRPQIADTHLVEPPDLTSALRKDKQARENFAEFAPSYRRAYLYWITTARRPDTRARRIAEAVERLARNEKRLLK